MENIELYKTPEPRIRIIVIDGTDSNKIVSEISVSSKYKKSKSVMLEAYRRSFEEVSKNLELEYSSSRQSKEIRN